MAEVTVRDEQAAAVRAAADAVAALAGRVGETHLAVARRAFRPLGPLAAPVRVVHDGVTTGVYAAVRGGARALGFGGSLALRSLPVDLPGPRLADRPRAGRVLSALNGAFGDTLARRHPALDLGMTVRAHGADVEPTDLATAFPDATGDVVVFLHGLCEDEAWWGTARSGGYAPRLRTKGLTPVLLRYNTGRHVSENGARLAALLDGLVAAWPVPVRRLSLVGHSMGGLVTRSACAFGQERGDAWVPLVRQVVYLGTPHVGAPLERAAARAVAALRRLPETRPLADAVAARSAGIKDLRHGSLLDADWAGVDPDLVSGDACLEVPLLASATHHVVSASLTRDPDHPFGRFVGDLLVQHPSAHGRDLRGRRQPFVLTTAEHIGGAHHFSLLDDAAVARHLEQWLAPDS
jgi:PGAP1-like protein